MKSRWGIVTCYIFLAIVFLIWNNAAKWVFLARVEWWAIAVLILVPLSALNALRSLFLGAYDLNDGREGFSVGFLLVVVSSSIAWTARLTEILGYARLREPMAQSFVPYGFWICALTLAVLVNFALVYYASDKTKRGKIVLGFMTGALLGAALWLVVDAVTGFFHNSFITMNPAFPLIQRIRSGLRQMPTWLWQGYLSPTNTTFDVESNHLGAFIGFVLSSSVYLWFRKRFIPPVCYLLLLLTMLVWGLSGLSFFLDTFRGPTDGSGRSLVSFCSVALRRRSLLSNSSTRRNTPHASCCNGLRDPGGTIERSTDYPSGGIQAAAWTARVLSGLEEICNEKAERSFSRSIKLLSGVSGGSVGVMYFAAALNTRYRNSAIPLGVVADVAKRSSLAEATHGFAYEDFIRAVAPFAVRDVYGDRGQALEEAWIRNARTINRAYGDSLERATLSDWQKAAREGALPGIIFNSTVVERGERLTFSTVGCDPSIPTDPKSVPGFRDFTSLYPETDILISTAVRLSSTFMFVSPAARPLCATKLVPREDVTPATRPAALDNLNLHIVDGGYYDNSGVTALVQWLHSGLSRLKNSSKRLPKKILIIEINGFPSVKEKYVKEERGTLFQFWAPFLTMFTIRGAAHESSATRELALLRGAWPNIDLHWIDFRFQLNSTGRWATPPVSWHLRSEEQKAIDKAWSTISNGAKVVDVLQHLGLARNLTTGG